MARPLAYPRLFATPRLATQCTGLAIVLIRPPRIVPSIEQEEEEEEEAAFWSNAFRPKGMPNQPTIRLV